MSSRTSALRALPLLVVLAGCTHADASSNGALPAPPPEAPLATPAPVPPIAPAPAPEPVVAAPPPAPAIQALELRTSHQKLTVRKSASATAAVRGTTAEDGVFRVLEMVEGSGCKDGWARLEADGYLCLTGTTIAEGEALALPAMVTFDPPEPVEFEKYMADGTYDHAQPDQLTPAVYAKRWKRFKGQLYASQAAFEAGSAPVGALTGGTGMKYRFEEIVETAKGPVLTRSDGKVARLDDVYLYPITRWQGRKLEVEPPPADLWPAITVKYEGAEVRTEPRADAPVIVSHPWHTPLYVEKTAVSEDGHWWRIPDAGGPGVPGYLDDLENLRHPVTSPVRPEGVGDGDLWVDVELSQQILQVFRGDTMVYWTVIASGAPPKITPTGTYRILGKYAYKDMASRADAEDVYYVEDVPWTMVFRPQYALHAAYWHWGFGRVASHGCVNLAVKDARWLFENLAIPLPAGWEVIYPTEEESAVVRIRRGDDVGRDRRAEFASL